MKRLFDQKEISRILAISERRIRYWDRIGLVPHLEKEGGQLWFDFQRLVAFRAVLKLLAEGISLRKVRQCVEELRRIMPEVEQPLSEIRIFGWGGQIVLCRNNLKFTLNGQLLIDFDPEPGSLVPLPSEPVEELFFQALECEETGDWEGAKRTYTKVLNLCPDHVNTLVNMGNLMYQLTSLTEAEEYYRKALHLNPDCVEANYNLANLSDEQNLLDNAILFYQKAIGEDADFADAHFNLARVLEKSGDLEGAKQHWRRYLELEPSGEWADFIRRLLEEK